MKHLSILGATGSIGTSALEIVRMHPDRFQVKALTAANNLPLLSRQIRQFMPEMVAVLDEAKARELTEMLTPDVRPEILSGASGYAAAAAWDKVDTVVLAMVGAAGLKPALAAIEAGKDIALANKETLVMAGAIVMERVARRSVKLMPVDSEHSAIFQSMAGRGDNAVREILLTASGGPFLSRPKDTFEGITPEDALRHPNWSMGSKITIDSATLMNKGLEVIEARWLFDIDFAHIKVVVHPQSIIHSMVTYADGAVIAQMGIPDMKGAIAYGLSHPRRLPLDVPVPDFPGIGTFTFEEPDLDRFPCLALAYAAGKQGGACPAVLNAANEVAVAAFLENRLPFNGIYPIIDRTLNRHTQNDGAGLDEILAADGWARKTARELIRQQER